MNLEPPSDSKILVTTDGAHLLISVPHGEAGRMRYFVGLFLLVWLGGWAVGFGSTLLMLLSGEVPAFLAFWLIGWALVGGIPPLPTLQTYWGFTSLKDLWKSMFPKRTRVELDRRNRQSLHLRETNGNRLTVDADAVRLDIAHSASEIEREWPYQLLAKRYSLPSPQGR